jgi:hypothetical protein
MKSIADTGRRQPAPSGFARHTSAIDEEALFDPKRDSRKKGAAVAGGSKVNREASNRVDRSHSMSRRWTR